VIHELQYIRLKVLCEIEPHECAPHSTTVALRLVPIPPSPALYPSRTWLKDEGGGGGGEKKLRVHRFSHFLPLWLRRSFFRVFLFGFLADDFTIFILLSSLYKSFLQPALILNS
jgi:hypothetical protein